MPKIHADPDFAGDIDVDLLTISDLADPAGMVHAAIELYGSSAVTAAARCALTAHFDRRKSDYNFWFTVFSKLESKQRH